MVDVSDDAAVAAFRAYLRIKTVQPAPDYAAAKVWLQERAAEFSFDYADAELAPGKPVCILTAKGADPSLPAVVCNSHIDVVPVDVPRWTHDPFAADVVDGVVYARGAQDMKCVGIQTLYALARLVRAPGRPPLARTVHLTFLPDEEVGGADGAALLVKDATLWPQLNCGVWLDEGLAHPGPAALLYYGERQAFWFRVVAKGAVGHASRLVPGTAVAAVASFCAQASAFRAAEAAKLEAVKGDVTREEVALGDVVSLNITSLSAAVLPPGASTPSYNVIPADASCGVDMRVPPARHAEVVALLSKWVEAAAAESGGADVSISWAAQSPPIAASPRDDSSKWWAALSGAFATAGVGFVPAIFPAATDARFVREVGVPAYGFSPMEGTKVLLHDHDECLALATFTRGIRTFEHLIAALANVAA